jgi:pyridoxal 5'-phosphate synthase pdxS subunit
MSTTVGTLRLKTGLAEMLKGGVIMDVTDETQARIAEEAGAVAVMALERVPADIRRDGGVARMADPAIVQRIMDAVSIPVMAKCRIGHFAEARVLEALGVDFIDESEVLTPADEQHHVDKHAFKVPFVCGCRDLGEALRRIGEGAALLRTKGEAGTGDVVEAVRHLRAVTGAIRRVTTLGPEVLMAEAKALGAPYELVRVVAAEGKLPVPNSARHRHPADASSCACWGPRPCPSARISSTEPEKPAPSFATTHYDDPQVWPKSRVAGEPWGRSGEDSKRHAWRRGVGDAPAMNEAVGVLGLQGDYAAHAAVLRRLGRSPRGPRCRSAPRGLVISEARPAPADGARAVVRRPGVSRRRRLFGTCAGAILLAREVRDRPGSWARRRDDRSQRHGRRSIRSKPSWSCPAPGPVRVAFIRAPRYAALGPDVEVLARHQGAPVLVRQGGILAATFHPEITGDPSVHRLFLEAAEQREPDRQASGYRLAAGR